MLSKKLLGSSKIRVGLCPGCGACSGLFPNKVSIEHGEDGFLKPVANTSLSKDELTTIENICPAVRVYEHQENGQIPHDVWSGYYRSVKATSCDDSIRHSASSGGVITSLLKMLLEKKIVDKIVHIRAGENLQNEVYITDSIDDVVMNSGSRYSPSSPLTTLSEVLSSQFTYAFVGKPCDVSALRRIVDRDSVLKDKIKYMFSFFCAGVPSTNATKKLIKQAGFEENDITYLNYRGNGWPGFFTLENSSNEKFELSYKESWGNVLGRQIHFRCKLCMDGIGESADIVAGDAWDTDEKGYPVFTEGGGMSGVLTRTKVGEELFQMALDSGYLKEEGILDLDELAKIQPSQVARKQVLIFRLWALRTLGVFYPKTNFKRLRRLAATGSLKEGIKNYLGTLRRAFLYGKKK